MGRFIGPGGSAIHALQDRTNARIGVVDNGEVHYYAPSAEQAAAVKAAIEAATGTGLQVGCSASIKQGLCIVTQRPQVLHQVLRQLD